MIQFDDQVLAAVRAGAFTRRRLYDHFISRGSLSVDASVNRLIYAGHLRTAGRRIVAA